MSTSATESKFFKDLKGVSKGKKKREVKTTGTLEKLLDARETYEIDTAFSFSVDIRTKVAKETKKLNQYLEKEEIDYSEKDIADLVNYANLQDYIEDESQRTGVYIGSLITILTKENEAQDKRTIIEIPENHLDYLGRGCEKFDAIKIGINYANHVFEDAKEGNLLYVDRCEGVRFAWGAGSDEGKIDHITANTANGNCFAELAGCCNGRVDYIIANTANGDYFADDAGSSDGKVNYIIANEVNGYRFAGSAGNHEGKVDYIIANTANGDYFAEDAEGKILKNSPEATELYGQKIAEVKKVLAEHGIDWGEEL